MVTSAFKSNSKRCNDYEARVSPKSNPPPIPNPPPPEKQRLRRSLSVNALSRSTQIDISSEFLNKRDNPLYWPTGASPTADNNTQTPTPIGVRGRSVNRNSDFKNGGQKEEIAARRRSLSRVNHNSNDRRGRSVSRAKLSSQSGAEQESRKAIPYGGSTTEKLPVFGVKAFERQSSHPSRHPSVGSSFDSQVSGWEDRISTSSLSEAEEKTIKAVYEQMKSFEGENFRKGHASSEIYETVRSEVRRAIADIQDDLQDAIRRTSSDVIDISPKLVKPEAVELVLDIRREYVKELEESQERARKLRSELAIEEHRKQELSRILKETLPEPNTSSSHRSRLGRKSSSERKKMSKRLTDEAMSYFDECVSISTFDNSDFSAAEDPSVNSAADQQMIHGDPGYSLPADNSSNELVTNRDNTEQDRKFHFSFGHKPAESLKLQHEFKNYIKTFEKDKGIDGISCQKSRDNYDVDVYNLLGVNESLLFDKVFFKNRQESGSLHICGGGAVPILPFGHYF